MGSVSTFYVICLLKAYEDLWKLECQEQCGREKLTTVQDAQEKLYFSKLEAITISGCFIQISNFSCSVTEEKRHCYFSRVNRKKELSLSPAYAVTLFFPFLFIAMCPWNADVGLMFARSSRLCIVCSADCSPSSKPSLELVCFPVTVTNCHILRMQISTWFKGLLETCVRELQLFFFLPAVSSKQIILLPSQFKHEI